MKRLISTSILAIATMGLCSLCGCEREIARTSETTVKDDGTVKEREKTVTEDGDGDITVTEEKSTTKPD